MNADIWEPDDPRRFRSVRYLFCLCRWFPILMIVLLTIYGYYAYVIVLCIQLVDSDIQRIVYIVVVHMLLLLYASTFFRAVFTWHARVPPQYSYTHPPDSSVTLQEGLEEHRNREKLILHQRTPTGDIRYCQKCAAIKPDRAHHCVTCNRCILKMDHHCPWINNCCGYSNYKYFILFVNYSFLLCLYIALTGGPYCVLIFTGSPLDSNYQKYNLMVIVLLSAAFSFSTAMLGFFHIYLTLQNSSTMETSHPPLVQGRRDKYAYFIGRKRNLEAVFGRNLFLGLIPIDNRPGNGYEFELNPRIDTSAAEIFSRRPVATNDANSATEQICNDIRPAAPVSTAEREEDESPGVGAGAGAGEGEESRLLN